VLDVTVPASRPLVPAGASPDPTDTPATGLPARRAILSPLRYPGGKRRLVPYVAAAMRANNLVPDLFVEPFAGGASVALELAELGLVKQIALCDLDPWVASFWQTVFEDCDWLCNKVETIDVTLATWDRLKRTRAKGRRWQALACLYLNRTSFNGTLHHQAGPIGGRTQQGAYDLACRFPRARLISRIRACERLAAAGKVAWVACEPALAAITRARSHAHREGLSMFTYLDPPFWAKSSKLYRYSFVEGEHDELAEALRWLREPWLLSYDLSPEVNALYQRHDVRRARVELVYTGTQRTAYEELVIANLQQLPADTRLWRTTAEWTRVRRSSSAR
jgi:DNA adenine methylase